MYGEVVVFGVLLSLCFSELTGLVPAGLIVPGYLALALKTPQRVVYTLLIALLTWGVYRLLTRIMILYGRRRFAVMILLAFLLNWIIELLPFLPYTPGIIGYLVPGIMAQSFERQGCLLSLLSLTIVTGMIALCMLWMGIPVF